MLEELIKWASPIMAIGAFIGSYQLLQYRQAQQEKTDSKTNEELDGLTLRVNDLEKREGIADAKREEMVRMLTEHSSDVKIILQEIAKLATMMSIGNSEKSN